MDSKDSDQTGRMPRLVRVFPVRICHFVGKVMRWLAVTERMRFAAFAHTRVRSSQSIMRLGPDTTEWFSYSCITRKANI